MRENLRKVKPGVYISKNDTAYYEKILRFEPDNPKALYVMGQKNEKAGATNRAAKYYKKASDNGNIKAYMDYKRLMENKDEDFQNQRNWKKILLPVILLIAFLPALLLFYNLSETKKNFITEKQYEIVPDENSHYVVKRNNNTTNTFQNNKDKLLLNTARTALINYKNNNGHYPENIQKLKSENYVSYLPEDIFYHRHKKNIKQVLTIPEKDIPYQKVKLVINKKNNVLYYFLGKNTISYFKVGLGKNNSTPTGKYTICERVKFPQPESAYGTRGFSLSNSECGIHGTYNKKSIGKNLSHGCIRMLNKDIEKIYPYIPLGTKVKITAEPVQKDYPEKKITTNLKWKM